MKISCPSCEAKYSIGDDKVQSRLAKIRCRKCGVDIVIDGRVQPPTVSVGESTAAAPKAMQAAAAATPSYTIDFGENDQRAMTLREIVSSYNAGHITPETYVWADGMSDWTALGQITEIVDALNAAAAPAAHAPSASATRSTTTTARTATTTSSTTATKTSSRTAGRGGADLFGSIARAGGEDDMARQAASAEPAASQTTGSRNESSVLFSLSALTSSAKSVTGPARSMGIASSSAASREDSGLIDLKALTAQASEESAARAAGGGLGAASPLGGGLGSPLGGFGAPLGGAAPVAAGMGAPAFADIYYPQKKNRVGLFIGGGIAVGIIVIGLVFALKPEPPPPPKVDPSPVIVYKTREPEPIRDAKPPPTGEPSAATAPKAAGKWRPRAKASGSSSSGENQGESSSSPASTPKAQGGKCGCAPGDLACNMRCAAKGG